MPTCRETNEMFARMKMSITQTSVPIEIRINCPMCHTLHVDEGIWTTKPHHTHACQACGHVWRPAVVNTVGVRFLPGFKDDPSEVMCEKPAEDGVIYRIAKIARAREGDRCYMCRKGWLQQTTINLGTESQRSFLQCDYCKREVGIVSEVEGRLSLGDRCPTCKQSHLVNETSELGSVFAGRLKCESCSSSFQK